MECTSLSGVRRIELDGVLFDERRQGRQVAQHARSIAALDEDGQLAPLASLGARSYFRFILWSLFFV